MTIKQAIEAQQGEPLEPDNPIQMESTEEQKPKEQKPKFDMIEFLTRETGDGEVSEYLSHPLNFNQSQSIGKVIRGFTGLLGKSLKFAILDIITGLLQFSKERKVSAHATN